MMWMWPPRDVRPRRGGSFPARRWAEVLSRVSGLAHVPRNAEVRAALSEPEAYYNRFVYLEDGALRIQFVPSAILALVDAARLAGLVGQSSASDGLAGC